MGFIITIVVGIIVIIKTIDWAQSLSADESWKATALFIIYIIVAIGLTDIYLQSKGVDTVMLREFIFGGDD